MLLGAAQAPLSTSTPEVQSTLAVEMTHAEGALLPEPVRGRPPLSSIRLPGTYLDIIPWSTASRASILT